MRLAVHDGYIVAVCAKRILESTNVSKMPFEPRQRNVGMILIGVKYGRYFCGRIQIALTHFKSTGNRSLRVTWTILSPRRKEARTMIRIYNHSAIPVIVARAQSGDPVGEDRVYKISGNNYYLPVGLLYARGREIMNRGINRAISRGGLYREMKQGEI
jgi:hypothetical protein